MAATLLAFVAPTFVSCSLIEKDIQFDADMTGRHVVGISSGWAFVEADVDLSNGSGPLATPPIGEDVGSSSTDLDPIFGAGLKYLYYVTNNVLVGLIYEHRIFDPESTRPLSADVDIDAFGTDHIIAELRYQFDAMGKSKRFRPFASIQLGFVPEVRADGTATYDDPFTGGRTSEDIRLKGDQFFTLGFVVGGSYLVRKDMTLDFSVFYEYGLDPTEGELVLQPFNQAPLDQPTTFDGELSESGVYLTAGLSWVF